MSENLAIGHWTFALDNDRIAWLTLDKRSSSANSLSREVMEELDAHLTTLEHSGARALIVRSAKDQGFITGADIKEFLTIRTPAEAALLIERGQAVFDRLERLPFPTVAAIHKFALGGGMELALACSYRVVADIEIPSLGFPEVLLGLHPGFGGTVRSVRLAGPLAAMELMLTGRSLRPSQALKLGLIDRIVPASQLLDSARALALSPPDLTRSRFKHFVLNAAPVRKILAKRMRAQTRRRVRPEHYPAPFALIDLWQRWGARGATAMSAEAQSMAQLLCSDTSRNLVRVFFLQERLKSLGKQSVKAERVHVIGAGIMGADIAAWCALRGLNVTLQDRTNELVQKGMQRACELFAKRLRDPHKLAQAQARLRSDVAGTAAKDADLVIEAIFENAAAKQELYASVEPQMRADAVLASNTSSIMLESLASGLKNSGRFAGLHFFNPVARMPLVEVIRSEFTADEIQRRALAFVRQIDKLPLPCRSAPGFLVNRVLMPYLTQALRVMDEGVPLRSIDEAAEGFGMPMGPIELADVVGLDVIMSVGQVLAADALVAPPRALAERIEQKKLGRKSGEGFYVWKNDKPVKDAFQPGSIPEDLTDRLILSLANEAVAVLREGIVADADLIDAGVIFGTGFAPFRGGPIQYARDRGVEQVVVRLRQLAQRYGSSFEPDAGWQLLN